MPHTMKPNPGLKQELSQPFPLNHRYTYSHVRQTQIGPHTGLSDLHIYLLFRQLFENIYCQIYFEKILPRQRKNIVFISCSCRQSYKYESVIEYRCRQTQVLKGRQLQCIITLPNKQCGKWT